MGKQSAIQRINEIEGIRGILSLIVVVGHVNLTWLPWFWGCMEIFFAISGYLIGRIAIQHQASPNFWSTYLKRRVLRIWPLYFSVLTFCILATWFDAYFTGNPKADLGWGAVRNVFFLQNIEYYVTRFPPMSLYREAGYAEMFYHSWSVVMEEQFYLIAPFAAWGLYRLLGQRNPNLARIATVVILFLGLCIGIRAVGFNWWALIARMDAFVLGMLLAVVKNRVDAGTLDIAVVRPWMQRLFVLSAAATTLFVLSFYLPKAIPFDDDTPYSWRGAAGISLFAVFGVALVGICVFRGVPVVLGVLRLSVLQFLGRISYSTYLWHIPVLEILNRSTWFGEAMPRGLHTPILLCIVIAISYCSYRWIELPPLRIKPEFMKSSQSRLFVKVDHHLLS